MKKKKHSVTPAAPGAKGCLCSDELQARLVAKIRQDGPILLWIGKRPFPGRGKFRGLNLDVSTLSIWASWPDPPTSCPEPPLPAKPD